MTPPGTSDSPLTSPSFSSGQCNRAYWASQPQKSVTLQLQGGRETTKSERTCGGIAGRKKKKKNTINEKWAGDSDSPFWTLTVMEQNNQSECVLYVHNNWAEGMCMYVPLTHYTQ